MTLAELDPPSFLRWRAVVGRALARRGVPAADRDDLVQEVFMVVHKRGLVFTDERATRAWLSRAAWRVASNHRRARRRADDRLALVEPREPVATPEEQHACTEVATTLATFVAELPDDARTVFERIAIDGATAPEVARATGVNLDTVYAKLRRTKARWAARLASLGIALVLLVLAVLSSRCGAADERPALLDRAVDDRRAAALGSHDDRRVRADGDPRHPDRPARVPALRT
jgi:RNA polymerase sigma-70 factor (ECF subfamily)